MMKWRPHIQDAALVLMVSVFVSSFSTAAESVGSRAAGSVGSEPAGLAWDFWVPRDQLSPRELTSSPEFCAGSYRWPDLSHPRDSVAADFPIEATARRAQYWDSGEVLLEGDVVVTQGNRSVRGPRAELNHQTRDGQVLGLVQMEDAEVILRGIDARMNLDSKATTVNDAEFLLIEPEFRGTATRLEREENGDMRVTRGSFTRCEPTNNNWRITSRSFDIRNGSDFGTARHAVVRVKNVPIFYTPYISFPINDERKSGWLFPGVGFTSQNGLEFSPPYYLNLAPDYDAIVTPRYFQKRGVGIEAQFRHLSSWQKSRFVGSYLWDDQEYDGIFEKDQFEDLEQAGLVEGPFQPADRWLYGMYHEGDFGHWQTTVDYTAVSDRDYFRNLGTGLDVASRRELSRTGIIEYERGGLDMRFWAQRFDRLDGVLVDPYQRLPQLDLNYRGYLPGPLEWSLGASAVSFDRHNENLVGVSKIVGSRAHVEPRVRVPLSNSWGFMTLMGGYRYTAYDLEDTAPTIDAAPERNIGLGSVDSGLFFERELNLFGGSIQTLEPRLLYLYQQYQDQNDLPRFDASQLSFRYEQLWRDNRFSGIDRIGDANQLSVGLTSRLLNAASGRENLRASIGQIRYFDDRRVSLTGLSNPTDMTAESELAGELVGTVGAWSLGGNVVWDPNLSQFNEGGGHLRFRSDNDHILHLGYRYLRRADIDQTDVAFTWPVSTRYSLIGRWNYDLKTGRTVEGLAGIEYNDCCWQIRLIGRHYLDTPSARLFAEAESREGVYLQVVLKGLGGLGDSVEDLLSKSIGGYQMEDQL